MAAYRAALEEMTRERVPLDWATTQMNLGNALWTLGERESGTAHLEEAVAAFRAALEERTREGVPLDWAMTQNNLGTALSRLGERESGTARLEEAVTAHREALQELHARAGAAPVGGDADEPRQCTLHETAHARTGRHVWRRQRRLMMALSLLFVPARADYYSDVCRTNRQTGLALLSKRKE